MLFAHTFHLKRPTDCNISIVTKWWLIDDLLTKTDPATLFLLPIFHIHISWSLCVVNILNKYLKPRWVSVSTTQQASNCTLIFKVKTVKIKVWNTFLFHFYCIPFHSRFYISSINTTVHIAMYAFFNCLHLQTSAFQLLVARMHQAMKMCMVISQQTVYGSAKCQTD